MHIRNPWRSAWNIFVRRSPVEAQLVVTRRCNLSCGYCSEYDKTSSEIPFESLRERIDALHRLNTTYVSLLGGEPLMHSRVADIVAHASASSAVSMTTNGFLLSDAIVRDLNDAGLTNMQISIDTLKPDTTRYIQKHLKPLAPKLERLARLAKFSVSVNCVLCDNSRGEFRELLTSLRGLGFYVTVNLLHNSQGGVEVAGPEYVELWDDHYQTGNPLSHVEREYGRQLLQGERPKWKCRAGSRFLYVDEFGKAQFCSAQRGRLDKPITEYTTEDLDTHHHTYKGCESGCAVFCVYRASSFDNAPVQLAKALYRSARSGAFTTLPAAKPVVAETGPPAPISP